MAYRLTRLRVLSTLKKVEKMSRKPYASAIRWIMCTMIYTQSDVTLALRMCRKYKIKLGDFHILDNSKNNP